MIWRARSARKLKKITESPSRIGPTGCPSASTMTIGLMNSSVTPAVVRRPGSPRLPTAPSSSIPGRVESSGSRRRQALSAPSACRDPSRSSGPTTVAIRPAPARRITSSSSATYRTPPVGDVSRPSVMTCTKTCGTLRRAAMSMSACR